LPSTHCARGTAAFARVFASPGFLRALGGSLALTAVASIVSTAVGVAVALHLSRLPARTRTALTFVIALPLTFSGLIVAYGFILGYGRAGFVTQLLAGLGFDAATIGGALFTPVGLAFASSYYLIPRVVIGILPVLVNFDRAQLAAAESLGATPAQAFRQVLMPQVAGAGRRVVLPRGCGGVRRVRHRAGAGRHAAAHPGAAPVQPHLRNRLGLSGGRRACASHHGGVRERAYFRRVDRHAT
jgi:ABC-type sulfate transport system permease subunit